MMWSWIFVVAIGVSVVGSSIATIAGETECHRQYQENYQPLYGSCTAFAVLTACVEAEMPQDNIGVLGDMQERLDSKQPTICEDLDNCTGLIIRPEMCESVVIASSGNTKDEIAAMVVIPIVLVVLIVLVVRTFGSHRMPRIDPAKALHAMSIAHVITTQTNATHSQPRMGLPKIIDDDGVGAEFTTSMHNIPEENNDESNVRDSDDDYIDIVNADEEKEENNGNNADDDDDDDNDDDENNSASDDEEI